MKLLFDENLSRKLVARLSRDFPDSSQVVLEGLETTDDRVIWDFAIQNGYVIVTKDDDFLQRSLLRGHPPKVIIISLGNCTNEDVENAIRARAADISEFEAADDQSCLVIR